MFVMWIALSKESTKPKNRTSLTDESTMYNNSQNLLYQIMPNDNPKT